MIVEDLGVITPDVHALRDELGFPGMVILVWAFDGPGDNPHRLDNHGVHQVVYTSTHDTDTLAGHFPDRPLWPLLELALSSPAALAVVPAQDVLELGSTARMNRPGEIGGNWAWKLEPGQLGQRAGSTAARPPSRRSRAARDELRRLAQSGVQRTAVEERAAALCAGSRSRPATMSSTSAAAWGDCCFG